MAIKTKEERILEIGFSALILFVCFFFLLSNPFDDRVVVVGSIKN